MKIYHTLLITASEAPVIKSFLTKEQRTEFINSFLIHFSDMCSYEQEDDTITAYLEDTLISQIILSEETL